jgi:hypothetical protein
VTHFKRDHAMSSRRSRVVTEREARRMEVAGLKASRKVMGERAISEGKEGDHGLGGLGIRQGNTSTTVASGRRLCNPPAMASASCLYVRHAA